MQIIFSTKLIKLTLITKISPFAMLPFAEILRNITPANGEGCLYTYVLYQIIDTIYIY